MPRTWRKYVRTTGGTSPWRVPYCWEQWVCAPRALTHRFTGPSPIPAEARLQRLPLPQPTLYRRKQRDCQQRRRSLYFPSLQPGEYRIHRGTRRFSQSSHRPHPAGSQRQGDRQLHAGGGRDLRERDGGGECQSARNVEHFGQQRGHHAARAGVAAAEPRCRSADRAAGRRGGRQLQRRALAIAERDARRRQHSGAALQRRLHQRQPDHHQQRRPRGRVPRQHVAGGCRIRPRPGAGADDRPLGHQRDSRQRVRIQPRDRAQRK